MLYAARRPADPAYLHPCVTLRRLLPRAVLTAAHSRLSAIVATSDSEIILNRRRVFNRRRVQTPTISQRSRAGSKARGPGARRQELGDTLPAIQSQEDFPGNILPARTRGFSVRNHRLLIKTLIRRPVTEEDFAHDAGGVAA